MSKRADDKREGAGTALDRPPPFFGLELLIERIEGEPSRWADQMRRGLEIEARETDSLTSTPARRAVYAALLALPWGADHE
jgi:hypothetical protein